MIYLRPQKSAILTPTGGADSIGGGPTRGIGNANIGLIFSSVFFHYNSNHRDALTMIST